MSATETRPAIDDRPRFEEAWETKRLGELGELVSSGSYGHEQPTTGLVPRPVVTTAHISDTDRWKGKSREIRYFRPSDIERLQPVKGDLIVVKSSGSAASVKSGKMAFVSDDADPFIFTNFLLRFRPIGVNSSWVYYRLTSPEAKRRLPTLVEASTYPNLRLGDYFDQQIDLPPLPEQRAIAAALSDVDDLLQSLDRLIAKKRDVKQGAMQQLLTGTTRLPGFEGAWARTPLSDLDRTRRVVLSRGDVISKIDIAECPGDYPIYSSSTHDDGIFGRYGHFMFDDERITWSIDGGGHFFYRRPHKYSVTNVCGHLKVLDREIHTVFLAYQLQQLHKNESFDYTLKAHPSVIRGLYVVSIPTLSEQRAIAAVLSDMDAEIDALEARREKVAAIKQGMMQELLTGRTRLPIPQEGT